MKILHVVYSCVPGEFRGGVARAVYELARAQAELGHDVAIYTTDVNGAIRSAVPAGTAIRSHGVLIQYFGASESRWFRSTDLRRALVESTLPRDVIHSHNTFLAPNRYAAEAQRRQRKPLFYHVHGALDPLVVNRGWWKSLRKRAYIQVVERDNLNGADGVFALTGSEADQIRRYGVTAPISVVPNGIWLEAGRASAGQEAPESVRTGRAFRARFDIQPDQQVILFLGRIVPKKGVHVLLRVFAGLHKEHSGLMLVLAGSRSSDADYVRHLENIIAENQIQTAVRWTDFLNETEKAGAWAAATLISHVSESEGMAMSVLEAMAAGLPVIVSRECYMSKAAAAGALIEIQNDAVELRAAIESLLVDATLRRRLGETAREYVRQHHAWSKIAQQIVEVYQQAGVSAETRFGIARPKIGVSDK